MFTGEQIVQELQTLGITHVVWLPDSTLGAWEHSLSSTPGLKLVRVCREGEAWAVAAGLHLGGARPLVMIQCTGLFDSGDSLRNALFDYGLPLLAIIGYRSFLLPQSTDSAKTFTEPNLQSWGLEYELIDEAGQMPRLGAHFRKCAAAHKPGIALIAEGRM